MHSYHEPNCRHGARTRDSHSAHATIVKRTHTKRRVIDCLMTASGWFFDVFTVAINLSDVVSDIMVCQQFAADGEMIWFGLVVASLVIANIIFTAYLLIEERSCLHRMLIGNPPPRSKGGRIRRYTLVFCCVLPFAQMIPVVEWFLVTLSESVLPSVAFSWRKSDPQDRPRRLVQPTLIRDDPRMHLTAESDRSDSSELFRKKVNDARNPNPTCSNDAPNAYWMDGVHSATAAGEEEIGDVAASFHVLGRFQSSIKDHLATHGFFYAETVVESIPQVIIQLLAITFLKQITPIQVVSMGTSLLSIVSKGYVLSASISMAGVFWKFFCCSTDLFGLFYIFATLMERDAPGQVELLFVPGAPRVTYMTLIFVMKWVSLIAVVFVLLVSFGLANIRNFARNFTRHTIPWLFIVPLGAAVCAVPALVALEGVKLIAFVFILTKSETEHRRGGQSVAALLYRYVGSARNDAATAQKLRLMLKSALRSTLASDAATVDALREVDEQLAIRQLRQEQLDNDGGMSTNTPRAMPRIDELYRRQQYLQCKRTSNNAVAPLHRQMIYVVDTTSDDEPSDWEDVPEAVVRRFEEREAARRRSARPKQSPLHIDVTSDISVTIPKGTLFNTHGVVKGGKATRYVHRRPFAFKTLVHAASCLRSRDYTLESFISRAEISTTVRKAMDHAKSRPSESPILVLIPLYLLGQIFSLVFPILNASLYYDTHNLLQHLCLYAFGFSMLVTVALTPSMAQLFQFQECPVMAATMTLPTLTTVDGIFQMIERQHLPSMPTILADCIDPGIPKAKPNTSAPTPGNKFAHLPTELITIVGSIVQHENLDCHALDIKECRRIRGEQR